MYIFNPRPPPPIRDKGKKPPIRSKVKKPGSGNRHSRITGSGSDIREKTGSDLRENNRDLFPSLVPPPVSTSSLLSPLSLSVCLFVYFYLSICPFLCVCHHGTLDGNSEIGTRYTSLPVKGI